jgi:hypothetical protein
MPIRVASAVLALALTACGTGGDLAPDVVRACDAFHVLETSLAAGAKDRTRFDQVDDDLAALTTAADGAGGGLDRAAAQARSAWAAFRALDGDPAATAAARDDALARTFVPLREIATVCDA